VMEALAAEGGASYRSHHTCIRLYTCKYASTGYPEEVEQSKVGPACDI